MKKILSLAIILILSFISGCKTGEDISIYDNNKQNYLDKIKNVQTEKKYEIIEKDVFDLSSEGGHIIAVISENDLEYLQLTVANSTNTIKYEYSLFSNYLIISKIQVTFEPKDTEKPFNADNFMFSNVSQHTYILSGDEMNDLSGSDVELTEKEEALKLFRELLEQLDL